MNVFYKPRTLRHLLSVACIAMLLGVVQRSLAQAEIPNPVAPYWKTKGNSGTSSGTHFLGTTDNVSLKFRTNNTQRMMIDSTGLVGIGTTPVFTLDIAGGSTLMRNGNTNAGTTNSQLLFGFGNSSDYRHAIKTRHNGGATAGNAIDFWLWDQSTDAINVTGTKRVMTIDANGTNGSVGIGTATPSTALEVIGKTKTDSIRITTGATNGYVLQSDASGNGSWVDPATFATTSYWTANGTDIYNNNSGNVGIGVTIPTTKLDMTGTLTIRNGNTNTGTASSQVLFGFNSTSEYRHAIKTRHNGGATAGNAIDFWLWDQSTDASTATGTKRVMTIDGNGTTGSVGIGTATPTTALEVVGKTKTDSIRITVGATNGYVLQSDASGNGNWVDPATLISGGYWTANGTHIYNNNTANVGIGVNTPTTKLDMTGTLTIRNGMNSSSVANSQILFGFNGTSDYRHAIKTRHNGGLDAGNAIDFWVWDAGTDANAAVGTKRVMTIDGNSATGSVGIGISTPAAQLDVNGTTRTTNFQMTSGATNNYILKSDASGNGSWADPSSVTHWGSYNGASICNTNGGPVFVGAANYFGGEALNVVGNMCFPFIPWYTGSFKIYVERPNASWGGDGYKLSIQAGEATSASNSSGYNGADLDLKGGNRAQLFNYMANISGNVNLISGGNNRNCTDCSGSMGGSITFQMGQNNNGAPVEVARIHNNGFLGMGTTAPAFPIDVANSASTVYSNYGYLVPSGTGVIGTNFVSVPVSIRTVGRIVAPEFDAVSDARIKHITGRTDNAEDLHIINQLAITNYQYIDTIGKGNKVMKKVIAQELEQVYPRAVNTMTDVVPDIYAVAEIKHGEVRVKNDLRAGDKVQIIFEQRKELVEVCTASATSFTVDLKDEGPVFVFGKQVNDFRTVDYEALTTLAISALQQLSKEKDGLQQQLSTLQKDVELLKQLVQGKVQR